MEFSRNVLNLIEIQYLNFFILFIENEGVKWWAYLVQYGVTVMIS